MLLFNVRKFCQYQILVNDKLHKRLYYTSLSFHLTQFEVYLFRFLGLTLKAFYLQVRSGIYLSLSLSICCLCHSLFVFPSGYVPFYTNVCIYRFTCICIYYLPTFLYFCVFLSSSFLSLSLWSKNCPTK